MALAEQMEKDTRERDVGWETDYLRHFEKASPFFLNIATLAFFSKQLFDKSDRSIYVNQL